jgi:hypothetical protein
VKIGERERKMRTKEGEREKKEHVVAHCEGMWPPATAHTVVNG